MSDQVFYDYRDKDGKLSYQVVRDQNKDFKQRRPDGKGGWINNLKGVNPLLYRLPETIEAVSKGETVYIPEGERDVDNLTRLGLAATTNSGGAGKWQDSFSDHLIGADVVILPDNDDPGRKHRDKVAKSLQGKAKSIKSQRTIPMTDDMIKILKAHKAQQNEEKLFFGKAYHDEHLVFCSEDGRRIWPRNFHRQYTSLLKKAGIEHKKPHTMRHTCASLLLEAGEELKNVQEILGHSNIATTADIYSHIRNKTKKKALDKLNRLIKVDVSEQPAIRRRRKAVGK
jgi:5S rRNA maturation endonuclease (ribonuclease M5)